MVVSLDCFFFRKRVTQQKVVVRYSDDIVDIFLSPPKNTFRHFFFDVFGFRVLLLLFCLLSLSLVLCVLFFSFFLCVCVCVCKKNLFFSLSFFSFCHVFLLVLETLKDSTITTTKYSFCVCVFYS